jgi:hypothetical protein
VEWRPADESGDCFGWIARERMQRASHALRVDGRVYLVDPVDAGEIEERVRALGEPAAVLQLLDRHKRGCAAWARRLGVPHVRAWEGGLGDAPFEALRVRDSRLWHEVALWEPAARTLLCAEALGTVPAFLAPGERIGWHPLVRPFPPRVFAGVEPARILVGHGQGLADGAAEALAELRAHGRRRTARAWLAAFRTSGSAASR